MSASHTGTRSCCVPCTRAWCILIYLSSMIQLVTIMTWIMVMIMDQLFVIMRIQLGPLYLAANHTPGAPREFLPTFLMRFSSP